MKCFRFLDRSRVHRGATALCSALLVVACGLQASGVHAQEPTDAVSLQEAIHTAYRLHGSIASAAEAVEASRQRVRQARTGTLPDVFAEVGYSGRGTSSLAGIFGGEPTTRVQAPGSTGASAQRVRQVIDTDVASFDQGIQPRITLSFNLWDGGLTRASTRQARAGLAGSIAGLATTRNNLAFTVTSDYLLQLRAARILELRREQERLAEEQLRSVEANIRVGRAAEADRALILSELRNRQVDTIQAQNDFRVAANALRNSMGLPVGPALQLVELRENTEAIPEATVLHAVAQRERPEVRRAEAAVNVSRQGVAIARIGRKPRLDTLLSFAVNPNDPFRRGEWTVGAAVSMPLWDAGRTHAREMEARADVRGADAELDQVRKDVAADVEEARLNLINSRERLTASRLAVDAARVNLEQTQRRYLEGVAGLDVVDLIQAQVQFATANNSAIQALYDVHLAQAQLNRALGRL